MRIIIDGDATSGINLISNTAQKNDIPCFIFCDFTHNIESEYSKVFTVDKGYQSVDMKIMEFIKNKDIVITQDYGLASLCLSKKCYVIDPKGKEYTDQNIDILLQNRYLNMKSKRKKGPKKRTIEDDKNLIMTLERIIGERK